MGQGRVISRGGVLLRRVGSCVQLNKIPHSTGINCPRREVRESEATMGELVLKPGRSPGLRS